MVRKESGVAETRAISRELRDHRAFIRYRKRPVDASDFRLTSTSISNRT